MFNVLQLADMCLAKHGSLVGLRAKNVSRVFCAVLGCMCIHVGVAARFLTPLLI
jgi:hypothetical protein